MTDLCTVSLATGRVLDIPGQAWTQDPPADVRRLRAAVHAQMRALDAMLRESGLAALLMPRSDAPAGAVCHLDGTAYR